MYSEFFHIPFGSSLNVNLSRWLGLSRTDFQQHPQLAVIITSSLFIEFERMSNDWKVEEVNYEFGIKSFLR
jgi:hypothetical protein